MSGADRPAGGLGGDRAGGDARRQRADSLRSSTLVGLPGWQRHRTPRPSAAPGPGWLWLLAAGAVFLPWVLGPVSVAAALLSVRRGRPGARAALAGSVVLTITGLLLFRSLVG